MTLSDPDGVELGKLLEMKGLKRSEQTAFLDIFKETKPQVTVAHFKPIPVLTFHRLGSVADPHHFDADTDPDPACYFDADPDPTSRFVPDPDPSFQIKAQNLEKVLK